MFRRYISHFYYSWIYFILGGILLIIAFPILFSLILVFVALSLINHGLRLRGLPPLQVMFRAWFNLF